MLPLIHESRMGVLSPARPHQITTSICATGLHQAGAVLCVHEPVPRLRERTPAHDAGRPQPSRSSLPRAWTCKFRLFREPRNDRLPPSARLHALSIGRTPHVLRSTAVRQRSRHHPARPASQRQYAPLRAADRPQSCPRPRPTTCSLSVKACRCAQAAPEPGHRARCSLGAGAHTRDERHGLGVSASSLQLSSLPSSRLSSAASVSSNSFSHVWMPSSPSKKESTISSPKKKAHTESLHVPLRIEPAM